MNKFICKIFGCKFKYNFPSIPSKAICSRCKKKFAIDLKKLEWREIEKFDKETRTDKQLIEQWI